MANFPIYKSLAHSIKFNSKGYNLTAVCLERLYIAIFTYLLFGSRNVTITAHRQCRKHNAIERLTNFLIRNTKEINTLIISFYCKITRLIKEQLCTTTRYIRSLYYCTWQGTVIEVIQPYFHVVNKFRQ